MQHRHIYLIGIGRMVFFRLKQIWEKSDAHLLIFGLLLYSINRFAFKNIVKDIPVLGYFFKNFFNDILGGFCFVAFLNLLLKNSGKECRTITNAMQAGMVGLCCGLLWEYIFPLIYVKGTSDPFDIIMYIIGSCLYTVVSENKKIFKTA